MNTAQLQLSAKLLGASTVEMLQQAHLDALWVLENLGVLCHNSDITELYSKFEDQGLAAIHENRIYITTELTEKCLENVPGLHEFFVPLNSLFIGGTAPYLYDDHTGRGGRIPTPDDAVQISSIAGTHPAIAGMGRGIKLKDELEQIQIMSNNCPKPLYFAVTSPEMLKKAVELHTTRGNIMVVFCLTRPPLAVNDNFSGQFVDVVRSGLPVFISSMPMAGVSAPYCYNGVLSIAHAEVLFGICTAQLLRPGATVIHAGFPTIADPRDQYNPNYGLTSHFLLNILMAHINLLLDIPTCQSLGTTNEEHPTARALADSRAGIALGRKYHFHMMRHPFGFLKHLVDFSITKLEKTLEQVGGIGAEDAPEVEMPVYDERGLESIKQFGLSMYMEDPLTTANIGKVFGD